MPKDPEGASSTRHEAAPDGQARVIEAVDSIEGAERYESDGIAIDVPDGFSIERTEVAADTSQLTMRDPARDRSIVNLTVTTGQNATDPEIDAASMTSELKLGASGALNVSRTPATWVGWPHAVSTQGTLPTEAGGASEGNEFILVTLRSDTGAVIVTASAEADPGELEDSLAFEALRTLRQAE